MIHKCANPECPKNLMRLSGGRFFGFPTRAGGIEHFWLCAECSTRFTLILQQGKVELEPRKRKKAS